MRSFAFLMIMISAFGFGLELLKPVKCRIMLLQEFCRILEIMSAELTARPSAIDELCCKLNGRSRGAVADFFEQIHSNIYSLGSESFSEIWNVAVDNCFDNLSSEQTLAVKRLGDILGGYELNCQINAINVCLSELKSEFEKLKSEYPTNRKLCVALPCSLAAMLVVILI